MLTLILLAVMAAILAAPRAVDRLVRRTGTPPGVVGRATLPGMFGVAVVALAAVTVPPQLVDQWFQALPLLLGAAVSFVTELLTKSSAPAWLKRSVAAVLSVLAGVLPTVTLDPHAGMPAYLGAVALAWVTAIATHASGITAWLQSLTSGFGVGSGPSGDAPAPPGPQAAAVPAVVDPLPVPAAAAAGPEPATPAPNPPASAPPA